LTGDTAVHIANRHLAFERITQFNLPDNKSPERYYHSLICALPNDVLNPECLEIVQVARQIVNVGDNHKYFDDAIVRMDFTRAVGLNKLVDILSLVPEWEYITINIRNWLDSKSELVIEN
jgi:hypothetical protein